MSPGLFYAHMDPHTPPGSRPAFIRCQDKNAIHARQRSRRYILTPGIIQGVLLYAVLRLSERFYCVASVIIPVNRKPQYGAFWDVMRLFTLYYIFVTIL